MQTPDHVLQDFSKAQQEELPLIIQRAADAAQAFVTDGIIAAMNTYNQKI
jgi:PTH1 family peptidyl-tRNA hydrolase